MTNKTNVVKRDDALVVYGRKLNNRARALVHDALDRLTRGDMKDAVGTHGRTFPDQLAHELLESPWASVLKIDAATPSDEGEDAKGGAPSQQLNVQSLYLMALQGVQKRGDEAKVIEGTIGVGPDASAW